MNRREKLKDRKIWKDVQAHIFTSIRFIKLSLLTPIVVQDAGNWERKVRMVLYSEVGSPGGWPVIWEEAV